MHKFNERVKTRVTSCGTCKHCLLLHVDEDEPEDWQAYCMLGVSEDDMQYLYQEIDSLPCNLPADCMSYSDRFQDIMLVGDHNFLEESCRRVYENLDVCQFYEEEKDE